MIVKMREKGRVDKTNYYLDVAEVVSTRGTCLKNNYGSVIVKNDEIISTGYTGSPRGNNNCCDLGYCNRKENNAQSGLGYELCPSVHSEQNAIISASRQEMIGATLYLVGVNIRNHEYKENAEPCMFCKRAIMNAGIEKVVVRIDEDKYKVLHPSDWTREDIMNNE